MITRRLWACALVLVVGLLAAGCGDDDGSAADPSATQQIEVVDEQTGEGVSEIAQMDIRRTDDDDGAPSDEVVAAKSGSTVSVTVAGVTGYERGELAGIVMKELDGLVVGGFATAIEGDPFTITKTVTKPAETGDVRAVWPLLSDKVVVLEPGEYVLTLWIDTGLGAYTRWFPMNTDGQGLAGCVHRFYVRSGPVTEVVVGGDVSSTGYIGVCEPATGEPEDVTG
ncbi:MAG: hypothetical protein ACN4GZ_04930 [Acidimicrobiales bacterium]